MPSGRSVILCAHGTRSHEGALAIASMVEAIRVRRPDLEVHEAYVDVQEPPVGEVAERLAGRSAVLVPLLLSAGYHVHVDLQKAADRAGATLAPTLGPDRRLSGLMADALGDTTAHDAVVLAAAGSSDDRADADLAAAAGDLAQCIGRPVQHAHAAGGTPRLDDVIADLHGQGRRVAVAGYLLAPGHFSRRLAECGADVVTPPFLRPDSPPPAAMVDLVLDRIEAAGDVASAP